MTGKKKEAKQDDSLAKMNGSRKRGTDMNRKANAIMDALSNIDENYIAAADRDRKQSRSGAEVSADGYHEYTISAEENRGSQEDNSARRFSENEDRRTGNNNRTNDSRRNNGNDKKVISMRKWKIAASAAAAVLALSIILPNTSANVAHAMQSIPVLGSYFRLVTFRQYSYEDDHHSANVDVQGIEIGSEAPEDVREAAEQSATLTNEQITEKTDELVDEFKSTLKDEGYTSLDVKTEVVTDSDEYYVLKLSAFQSAADGYEQNEFFTLSKKTGEIVHLKDLFKDGADYVSVISNYLIDYMEKDMKADDSHMYFVGDTDMPEFNFTSIAEDQQFYINAAGNLVICFNEGDVAPMSMGALEFEIPNSVIADILK
jgi:hypothetical protein